MAKPEQLVNARAPQIPVPSLDLLQSFAAATALPLLQFPLNGQEEQELGVEGLELSLGLSLNGRFGINPGSSKLARSASISYVNSSLCGDFNCDGFGSGVGRTCSLPVENKGEIGGGKKRKDAMTWPRLEARRRKIEKLRDADPCETSNNSGVSTRHGLIGPCLNGYDKIGVTGKSVTLRQQLVSMLSQRSRSLRTECQEIMGVNNDTPRRSIRSVTPQEKERNTPGISQECPRIVTNPREPPTNSANEKLCNGIGDDAKEEGSRMLKTVLESMPCVSAKGDGPNGRKVEGFLYRYRKGEEVRIVCICHGSFFTPAEFVKHAGRGDVSNPLKHIVVNTSSIL